MEWVNKRISITIFLHFLFNI